MSTPSDAERFRSTLSSMLYFNSESGGLVDDKKKEERSSADGSSRSVAPSRRECRPGDRRDFLRRLATFRRGKRRFHPHNTTYQSLLYHIITPRVSPFLFSSFVARARLRPGLIITFFFVFFFPQFKRTLLLSLSPPRQLSLRSPLRAPAPFSESAYDISSKRCCKKSPA